MKKKQRGDCSFWDRRAPNTKTKKVRGWGVFRGFLVPS